MIVEELVASLGFNYKGQADVQRFQRGMENARRGVHGLSTAAKQAAVAMSGFQNTFKTAFLGGFAGGSASQITETVVRAFRDMTIGVAKSIIETGESFENLGVRLETLEGSSERAQKAMDWVVQFAKDTPLQIEEVTEAYARLRNFGIDPTAGSLAALTDATAGQGKGGEHLLGIITAVGQAWTKQKFQAEEANQLLERGVPAWNLLSKATGKSVAELMKLSEAGKIGQREISLLIQEIGKEYTGASAKMAQTSQGIRSVIKDTLTIIRRQVDDAGWFDLWKQQLTAVRGWLDDLAKNKSVKRWAWDALFWLAQVREFFRGKEVQDFIQTTLRELESLGTFLGGLKLGENTLREWETLKNTFGEIESTLAFVSRWMVQIWEKLQIPENILKGWERLSGWMSGIGKAVGRVFDQNIPEGGIRRRGPTSRSGGDAMRRDLDERYGPASQGGRNSIRYGTGAGGKRTPVAIRNFNPGAISLGDSNAFVEGMPGYAGKTPRPRNEGGYYALFESPEAGVNAAAMNLRSYGRKGINTPDQIVRRWSTDPGAHSAYSKRLQSALGVSGKTPVDLNDHDVLAKIIAAKSAHESGRGKAIYDEETFRRGVRGQLPEGPHLPDLSKIGPQSSRSSSSSYADHSTTNIKIKVAGTRATADEIGGAVGRAIRNRGRDVAKSLFIEAQEPQTA